jgi:two-component system CheB/CheR fusion protein
VDRVVGIGASAGGLSALERLISRLPERCDAAFVVVQHLSPDHKSLMAEILARQTRLPVREATDGMALRPGEIYLCPPHHNVEVAQRCLRLKDRASGHTVNLPVDQCLRSLAADCGARAVAVILSGTGSDGRLGVQSVKAAGGLVFAQSPTSARFDGMPLAAIATGLVDAALSPEEIGQRLSQLVQGLAPEPAADAPDDPKAAELPQILDVLLRETGFDFREYKTATVLRRLERRMGLLGLVGLGEYLDRLRLDVDELRLLAQDMLVSVTRFFRDEAAWSTLATQVLATRVAPGNAPLRAWIAGCATGPEAYTLAMLLTEAAEAAGREADFKLFATDLDREALSIASAGLYDREALADVSPARLERFFEPRGEHYAVQRELRRHIVFAEHNLVSDAPFIRMDIVTCRNVLIYMQPALQQRVLASLAFSLKVGGVLLLGASESLGHAEAQFHPLDPQHKVFTRRTARSTFPLFGAGRMRPSGVEGARPITHVERVSQAAQRLLLERGAHASLLLDAGGDVVQVYGNREGMLALPTGMLTRQALPMVPEAARALVSTALRRARTQDGEVRVHSVEPGHGFDVRVERIAAPQTEDWYFLLTLDRSAEGAPRSEGVSLADSALVEALEQELSSARASLHASIEELETSNEELQATNEELVASNEELQATNEELRATTVGMLFLDEGLNVRRYSAPVTAVVPLQPSDVRRPLADLATRIVDGALVPWCEQVLETGQTLEREVSTTDASRYLIRIAPYTQRRTVVGVVVSILDTTPLRTALVSAGRLQRIIDSLPLSAVIVDGRGVITQVNAPWLEFARANGAAAQPWIGMDYLDAAREAPTVRAGLAEVLAGRAKTFAHIYPCDAPGTPRWFMMHAAPMQGESGAVITHLDITALRVAEAP